MSVPPPRPPGDEEPPENESTVVLSSEQLAAYMRALEEARAARGQRSTARRPDADQPAAPPPRRRPPPEPNPRYRPPEDRRYQSPPRPPPQQPPPPPQPPGRSSSPRPSPQPPRSSRPNQPPPNQPPPRQWPAPGPRPSGQPVRPPAGPGDWSPPPRRLNPPQPYQPSPFPRPAAPPPAPQPAPAEEPAKESIGRSSRIMMIATAGSRLTGFLRSLAIAAAIGFGFIGDAYNTANTLPNIVYEFLLGGVLTSVVVPLLVHAQHDDEDGGEAYTQRLVALSTVMLAVATALAMVSAPLLTTLYVGSGSDKAHLTTVWALLLLPEILFYGVGAMFGAILNTRGVFGPPAWAPILNNIVVIGTAGVFLAMPGPKTLNLDTITSAQILVLGIGTTLGIVVQALVLMPYLKRVGFRWKWRLDVRGSRLGEAGGLALWVIGYVAINQVGLLVQTRLANGVDIAGKSYAVFANANMLFQMPYGILGVSLLTALMPRMSRAAARGDIPGMISDLSLGSRLSAVALVPVTGLLIALGPELGTVLFSLGRTGGGGHAVGVVLAMSAFGLVPFALTMLQLRVFYAVKDARTPTLIAVGMAGVKIIFSLVAYQFVAPSNVVGALAVVTGLSYVVGTALGYLLLHRRFGALDSGRMAHTTVRLVLATAAGSVVAYLLSRTVTGVLGEGTGGLVAALVVAGLVGGVVIVAACVAMRVREVTGLLGQVRRRLG